VAVFSHARRVAIRRARLLATPKAPLEVGGTGQAEPLQGRGRKARAVALAAHRDHVVVEAGSARVAVPARGIHAPFEDVARGHERPRDDTICSDLRVRTDIDQGCARRIAARAEVASSRSSPRRGSASRSSIVVRAIARKPLNCPVSTANKNPHWWPDNSPPSEGGLG